MNAGLHLDHGFHDPCRSMHKQGQLIWLQSPLQRHQQVRSFLLFMLATLSDPLVWSRSWDNNMHTEIDLEICLATLMSGALLRYVFLMDY